VESAFAFGAIGIISLGIDPTELPIVANRKNGARDVHACKKKKEEEIKGNGRVDILLIRVCELYCSLYRVSIHTYKCTHVYTYYKYTCAEVRCKTHTETLNSKASK